MSAPTLHLVRHGESTWNAAGLLQGATGSVPLTARGREQARVLARALADRPVVAVWSSDLQRALGTAAPIAAAHGLAVRPVAALREQGHGVWEGGPAAGRTARLAAARPDWAPPGGESARALLARVATFLTLVLDRSPPGEVVLVSHGETLRAVLAALHGLTAAQMPRGVPANATVQSLRRRAGDGAWVPVAGPAGAGPA